MDKDWAENEAMKVSAEATGIFSLSVSDEPWLRETITTLLRKVRREAINNMLNDFEHLCVGVNLRLGEPNRSCSLEENRLCNICRKVLAIRESEGINKIPESDHYDR